MPEVLNGIRSPFLYDFSPGYQMMLELLASLLQLPTG